MILNKQYFIHFGIKLFWLICSFYMGKWFFNYQVEYIHHYLFRMLVDASKPPTNTRLQRYTKVLNCANVGEGTFLRLSKLFFSTPITLMSLDKRLSASAVESKSKQPCVIFSFLKCFCLSPNFLFGIVLFYNCRLFFVNDRTFC